MKVSTQHVSIRTQGQGLHSLDEVLNKALVSSGLSEGTLTVFCQHTSCSLVIMENADPTARADLEAFMNRLVPEGDPSFTHTLEGADDMPSHIKMALTRTSEVIPFEHGRLSLGTWQGVFLWEHRRSPHHRRLVVSVLGQ